MEDETICLSVLLGLDVGRTTRVPVLHWRLKDLLAKLKEFAGFLRKLCPRRQVYRAIADFIGRWLRRSHEDRMMIFLSQFEFFSEAMLFWNTPCLQRKGWRWAPFSFLSRGLDIDAPIKGGRRGYLTKKGLIVKCAAISLQEPSFLRSSDGVEKQLAGYDYLSIEWNIREEDFQDDLDLAKHNFRTHHGAATVWKWAQLHQRVTWPRNDNGNLRIKGQSKNPERLVILLGKVGKEKKMAPWCPSLKSGEVAYALTISRP